LAKKNLERWQKNAAMGGVSKQEVDQHEADYKSSMANINLAEANIQQQEANIKRLQALRSYEIIRAPFTGMITEKNVDPGANIVAGGSVTSTSLFTIVQSDTLRIFVDVPQSMMLGVHKGLSAQLTVPEMPNQQFTAKVARLAGALDEKSRTLRVELHLTNRQHKLFPGMFARLSLNMPMPVQHLQIPDNTIVVANEGLKVAQVLPDNRVHFLSIQTGRDSGENTEVLSGLTGSEKLITNPSDTLKEGESVQPVE
jgi:RND family efflux transporter MFP subunit